MFLFYVFVDYFNAKKCVFYNLNKKKTPIANFQISRKIQNEETTYKS